MLQTKQQKAFRSFGPLAQLAEHLTFNQGVPRSSRGWITTQITPAQTSGSFFVVYRFNAGFRICNLLNFDIFFTGIFCFQNLREAKIYDKN